jgi:O6-methylguanine-DNA--protein-cysteine methyltransferase
LFLSKLSKARCRLLREFEIFYEYIRTLVCCFFAESLHLSHGNRLYYNPAWNRQNYRRRQWHQRNLYSHRRQPFEKIPATLKEAAQQLQEYFDGKRTQFDFRINPKGTDFSKSLAGIVANPIWQDRLLYGHHQKLGDVKAIRAVASANGKTHCGLWFPAIVSSAPTVRSPDMPAVCGARNGCSNTKARRRSKAFSEIESG